MSSALLRQRRAGVVHNSLQLLPLQLVHIRDDFGDGLVVVERNFLLEFGIFKQRARQRRVFHDRHVMFLGEFADSECDQILPFGDDLRRFHRFGIVLQRHGEMRRVGNHHIGFRHGGHHAAPCPFVP
jgi:hypothetical protein